MTSTASHMMKTTRRGRPFVKDTHDLFATLMITLPLETHRQFFKTYPNSFTTDDACNNLASLKFSQSNRGPDPKETSRIITTTTTTTFSMNRDMAKAICQHFMDAHLIENASDIGNINFKDRGIYMLTGKGLHVLERFVAKNGVASDHLLPLYATQNIIQKILHLERRSQDDELLITKGVVETVFKRFAGQQPNVTHLSKDDLRTHLNARPHSKSTPLPPGETVDRAFGILVHKVPNPDLKPDEKSILPDDYQFSAISACDWLLDYATVVGLDEAAELAGQFVRYGLITLVSDKGRMGEDNVIVTVKAGGPGGGAGAIMQEAEYRATDKATYKMTKEGIQVAEWNRKVGSNASASVSKPNLRTGNAAANSFSTSRISSDDQPLPNGVRGPTVSEVSDRHRGDMVDPDTLLAMQDHGVKDSHTARLKQILEDTALRSVFREFLRSNFCEENLNFWLEVQEFKKKFTTTSSAVATPSTGKSMKSTGLAAMEKHQQDLINQAFVIYNTYLAPASPNELNIDHNLRAELISYMNQISSDKDAGLKGTLEPGVGNTVHASQLQTMVKLYERIQVYIFRLMATDSVPKFSKTERFLNLMRSVYEYNEHDANLASQAAELTLKEQEDRSPIRAYLTISQAASEKQAAMGKPQQLA